jgi:hypothetical protein
MTKKVECKHPQYKGLPGYIIHSLLNANIDVYDLSVMTRDELAEVPGIGPKALEHIWLWFVAREDTFK